MWFLRISTTLFQFDSHLCPRTLVSHSQRWTKHQNHPQSVISTYHHPRNAPNNRQSAIILRRCLHCKSSPDLGRVLVWSGRLVVGSSDRMVIPTPPLMQPTHTVGPRNSGFRCRNSRYSRYASPRPGQGPISTRRDTVTYRGRFWDEQETGIWKSSVWRVGGCC